LRIRNLCLIIVCFLSWELIAESENSYIVSYYQYVDTLPPKDLVHQPKENSHDEPSHSCCEEECCCSESECLPQESCDLACYTPSFHNLICDIGIFMHLDFLYWYAKETDLSYAIRVKAQPQTLGSDLLLFGIKRVENLGTSWDPGVRLGIGCSSRVADFDLGFKWTWMKNTRCDKTSVQPFGSAIPNEAGVPFLITPWINQSFQRDSFALYDCIKARWQLRYNQFDLELGRKYWTGPCFVIRPFIAIRGAFWDTKFDLETTLSEKGTVSGTFGKDKFDNDAWGVGFDAGFEPTWYLCSCLALYGQFDGALLWGRHKDKKREKIFMSTSEGVLQIDYNNQFEEKSSQMTPQIDLGIGIRWEYTFCDCRYRSTLDVGWEHHILFDQSHRIKSLDGFQESIDSTGSISGFRSYVETNGNIALGGLIIRGRFDF